MVDKLKFPHSISLKWLFSIPVVVLLICVVGTVGVVSFYNGQNAVNEVASQLRNENMARIQTHLDNFLTAPGFIHQTSLNLIEEGLLDVSDVHQMQQFFLDQVQVHGTISSMYFGNPTGGIVGAGREGAAEDLYFYSTEDFKTGTFDKYRTDVEGNNQGLLISIPNFDARTRPWYTSALNSEDTTWSDVYILSTEQDMAIAVSQVVHDTGGNVLGVLSVDIFLSHLSDFLENIEISPSGQSFILDRSGMLIASSTGEDLVLTSGDTGSLEGKIALQSGNPVIAQTAQFLLENFGSFDQAEGDEQLTYKIDGERQFVNVHPMGKASPVDWMVVVVVPESDFMAHLEFSNRYTIGTIFLTTIAAGVGGILLSQWILRPIFQISGITKELSHGDIRTVVDVPKTRIREIQDLADSFQFMNMQLKEKVNRLDREIEIRRQTEGELQAEKEFIETALNTQTDTFFVFDLESRKALRWNKAFQETCEYTDEEIAEIALPYSYFSRKDQRVFYKALKKVLKNGIAVAELTMITKNGKRIPFEYIAGMFNSKEEGKKYLLAIGRDITARLENEEKIRALNDDLEQRVVERTAKLEAVNQELKSFSYSISHDLRAPIRAITGFSAILEEEYGKFLDASGLDYLHRVQNGAEKMNQLVDDLLLLSRLGNKDISPEEVNVTEISRRVFQELIELEGERNIEFVVQEQIMIHGDAALLEVLLTNLVDNAIKFTRGQDPAVIEVGCFQRDGEQVCFVRDNGIGFDMIYAEKIFFPFQRLHSEDEFEGTGIGLAIVRRIVARHGGEMWVEAEPGKGATFCFVLP